MADGLVRAFRFGVTLLRTPGTGSPNSPQRLGDGAFQECSGLELEQDVQEYLEGGHNDGIVRRVGRVKYPHLILKRGMFFTNNRLNRELWLWLQNVVSGVRPVARYNGTVNVYRAGLTPVARWEFVRGLPLRIKGPELNAKTGEVAIEELHIAHEGLRLTGI